MASYLQHTEIEEPDDHWSECDGLDRINDFDLCWRDRDEWHSNKEVDQHPDKLLYRDIRSLCNRIVHIYERFSDNAGEQDGSEDSPWMMRSPSQTVPTKALTKQGKIHLA